MGVTAFLDIYLIFIGLAFVQLYYISLGLVQSELCMSLSTSGLESTAGRQSRCKSSVLHTSAESFDDENFIGGNSMPGTPKARATQALKDTRSHGKRLGIATPSLNPQPAVDSPDALECHLSRPSRVYLLGGRKVDVAGKFGYTDSTATGSMKIVPEINGLNKPRCRADHHLPERDVAKNRSFASPLTPIEPVLESYTVVKAKSGGTGSVKNKVVAFQEREAKLKSLHGIPLTCGAMMDSVIPTEGMLSTHDLLTNTSVKTITFLNLYCCSGRRVCVQNIQKHSQKEEPSRNTSCSTSIARRGFLQVQTGRWRIVYKDQHAQRFTGSRWSIAETNY